MNTHGNDDYADDYADVYNAQDGDECEDSHEGYDTSSDWIGEEAAADSVNACELETVANNVTQDPELCSESIQDYTASVVKSRRGKGKGNKSGKRTPCNYCGQKGHWRPQCPLSSETSDSSEDTVKCSYMVVKDDQDPASSNQEEEYDCEPLPLRMKYQQMTFISVFLRRWHQVTAGSKMLEQMSKVTGGIDDTPMETAIMKAIRLTRGHYKPEPVLSLIHI